MADVLSTGRSNAGSVREQNPCIRLLPIVANGAVSHGCGPVQIPAPRLQEYLQMTGLSDGRGSNQVTRSPEDAAQAWAVHDLIRPIIHETYGKGSMSNALIAHMSEKIAAGDFDTRGREYTIMRLCWDWFSGGTTAATTARKIEAALGA